LAKSQQGSVAAPLIDSLTSDVQELSDVLGRQHTAGAPDDIRAIFDFRGEIDRLGIDFGNRSADRSKVGQGLSQSAKIPWAPPTPRLGSPHPLVPPVARSHEPSGG
jgi:hypothetical protein